MAAEPAPLGGQQASGPRAVAATRISGPVVTGDGARIDARAPVLGAGLPRPADVTVATGMHNLPRPPAAVFVGRADVQSRLERSLSAGASVVVTQAVFGLGGVGKSELALQHAHAHRQRYPLTWWITADEPGKVEAGLAALAGRVCPEVALTVTTTEAAAWALTWLQAHPGWLLILDDVSDPADVEPLLGQLHGGHILLTTRRDAGWRRIAAPMRLDLLAPGPAAALITSAIEQPSPDDERTAADIAEELGFLPLALDQAAAYIAQARIPLPRYLELLREHPVRMYAAVPAGGQAQRTIGRLWDITLRAITQADPAAARLLRVLACYAPDNIPRHIIGGPDAGPGQDEALALLASYSMITLTADTVTLHKLVQAVILAAPEDTADAPTPRDTAVDWLDDAMPEALDTNVAAWPFLRALAPHTEAAASRYRAGEESGILARVLNQLALFYQSQGAYQDALRLQTSCLGTAVRIFGDDHEATATYLGNLAATYSALGRHGEALPLEVRALAVAEAALGPDHPDTALRLGNLAVTYGALGRYGEALPLAVRALAVAEAALGPDHPTTAVRLGNLARTYGDLGRHGEALPLAVRALAVAEAALGPDHPSTARCLNNLAFTYGALGQPGEALPLGLRALAVSEAALGPDHPDTVLYRGNLVARYRAVGRDADAMALESHRGGSAAG